MAILLAYNRTVYVPFLADQTFQTALLTLGNYFLTTAVVQIPYRAVAAAPGGQTTIFGFIYNSNNANVLFRAEQYNTGAAGVPTVNNYDQGFDMNVMVPPASTVQMYVRLVGTPGDTIVLGVDLYGEPLS